MAEDLEFDPADYTVAEVLEYIEDNPEARDVIVEAERAGKARKGILEELAADDEEGGGLLVGATTTLREDFLGRDLVNPGTTAVDFLGRATTSTADFRGVPLRRSLRANTTAVSLNQEIQFTGGEKFVVTVAGTTAASAPAAPAVGATVADGTATLRRTK